MFKDIHHDLVKRLLEQDGWLVTHDPLTIRGLTRKIHIDFAAEKVIAAEREGQRIAIEVKSFIGPSLLNDFYEAIGKYELYWDALNQTDPARILFIALPVGAYDDLVLEPFILNTMKRLDIKLLVFNSELEKIEQWLF
jgi:hypothetical protein